MADIFSPSVGTKYFDWSTDRLFDISFELCEGLECFALVLQEVHECMTTSVVDEGQDVS